MPPSLSKDSEELKDSQFMVQGDGMVVSADCVEL